MQIVIIEDEILTAEDLAETIRQVDDQAEIVAVLHSIKEGIRYFSSNPPPDLIFSDIQLGDGLSFEIFTSIKIVSPVIFCTAFNEYALNAFKVNGIDYLLKPFTEDTIKIAMDKYHSLSQTFTRPAIAPYKELLRGFTQSEPRPETLLIHYKDKIIPITFSDIALFYLENELTHLLTFTGKSYLLTKSLEEMDRVAGKSFFRVNRQTLVNRKAIIDASNYFARKLSINLCIPYHEQLIVSKEKSSMFLNWLGEG